MLSKPPTTTPLSAQEPQYQRVRWRREIPQSAETTGAGKGVSGNANGLGWTGRGRRRVMVNMRSVSFPNWSDRLKEAETLSKSDRDSYAITIRWFLGHCKRLGRPATCEEARVFVREASEAKRPEEWALKRWKRALNWLFKNAPKGGRGSRDRGSGRCAGLSNARRGRAWTGTRART